MVASSELPPLQPLTRSSSNVKISTTMLKMSFFKWSKNILEYLVCLFYPSSTPSKFPGKSGRILLSVSIIYYTKQRIWLTALFRSNSIFLLHYYVHTILRYLITRRPSKFKQNECQKKFSRMNQMINRCTLYLYVLYLALYFRRSKFLLL